MSNKEKALSIGVPLDLIEKLTEGVDTSTKVKVRREVYENIVYVDTGNCDAELKAKEDLIAILQHEIHVQKNAIFTLNSDLMNLKKKIESLKDEINKSPDKEAILLLKTDLSNSQGELTAKEAELTQLKDKLAKSQDALKAKEGELTAKESELKQSQDALATKEAELVKSKDAVAEKDGELAKSKDELAKSKDELAKSKDALTAKEAELAKSKDAVAAKEAELAKSKDAVAAKEAELKQLTDKLAKSQDELTKSQIVLATNKANLTAKEDNLKQLQFELTVKESALAQSQTALQAKLQGVLKPKEDELKQSKSEIESLKSTIESQKISVETSEKEISSLKSRIGIYRDEIDVLNADNIRIKHEYEQLQKKFKQCFDETGKQVRTLELQKQEIEKLKRKPATPIIDTQIESKQNTNCPDLDTEEKVINYYYGNVDNYDNYETYLNCLILEYIKNPTDYLKNRIKHMIERFKVKKEDEFMDALLLWADSKLDDTNNLFNELLTSLINFRNIFTNKKYKNSNFDEFVKPLFGIYNPSSGTLDKISNALNSFNVTENKNYKYKLFKSYLISHDNIYTNLSLKSVYSLKEETFVQEFPIYNNFELNKQGVFDIIDDKLVGISKFAISEISDIVANKFSKQITTVGGSPFKSCIYIIVILALLLLIFILVVKFSQVFFDKPKCNVYNIDGYQLNELSSWQ